VSGVRERAMHAEAVRRSGRVVRGGAHQRMREFESSADFDQTGIDCGFAGRHLHAEVRRGTGEKREVAERLGRHCKDQELSLVRELLEALQVASLDPAGDRLIAGHSVSARETC
jgi:hypothetical protein